MSQFIRHVTVVGRQPLARAVLVVLLGATLPWVVRAAAEPEVLFLAGSTHAHSRYTWSHGEQWEKGKGKVVVADATSKPGPDCVLVPNWPQHQGPPAEHFARAKASGYDFYAVTDHSQEADLQPVSATNAAWLETKRAAAEATDDGFVALAGFEHSENNGPGGTGHLNVYNSAEYLNALSPGIDLPYLYRWLKTARPDGEGPIVACFNHPGPRQYNDWADRDPEITEVITLLEVINSNKNIHDEAWVNALDKGWKVSPVCGNDNHGFWGITRHTSRTVVLATSRTKTALLEAMRQRRTYATLDQNLRCRYTVNGALMGSTLERPTTFRFELTVSDPDVTDPKHRITRIDIVKDGGEVARTYEPTPDWTVTWSPTIEDAAAKYFFIRIYNAGGGDGPGADPRQPVAWLAPVWTGR